MDEQIKYLSKWASLNRGRRVTIIDHLILWAIDRRGASGEISPDIQIRVQGVFASAAGWVVLPEELRFDDGRPEILPVKNQKTGEWEPPQAKEAARTQCAARRADGGCCVLSGGHNAPHAYVIPARPSLQSAAERAAKFLAGLQLTDHPVAVQREYLSVTRELLAAVRGDKK